MLVLFVAVERKLVMQACLENLNGDLLQPSRTRYDSYPLVLDVFISLAYWKGLISSVILSFVVPTSHWKFLSVISAIKKIKFTFTLGN